MRIETARVRQPEWPAGHRVLVDRLWPRGIAKADLPVDEWAKGLAPSTELRKWLHVDREARHDEFCQRYWAELDEGDHEELLQRWQAHPVVVLLADSRELATSKLPPLADWLGDAGRRSGAGQPR